MSIATVVRGDAMRVMPWANGGGTTHEVVVFPPGAGLDDFHWRISVAEVSRDGDFSSFIGVDRVLVLIDGDAMQLTVDGVDQHLRRLQPVTFRGESSTSCTLAGGPTRDLNVMTRRGRAAAQIELLESRAELDGSLGELGIHCIAATNQTVWLALITGVWTEETAPSVDLNPGDFALIDGSVDLIGHGRIIRISVRTEMGD